MNKTFSSFKDYFRQKGLPIIPFNASDALLIREPSTFYETILERSRNCSGKIALSSLYIGTDSKERLLVNSIYDNLKNNSHLKVVIALDANRSMREDSFGRSSVSLLRGLKTFPVKVNLVDTGRNSIINKIFPLPKRWLEVLSTYHAKALVFDDDVVLTGANLSSIYFEKRQDRYMLLKNSKQLSNYIFGLIQRLRSDCSLMKETLQEYNCQFMEHPASSLDGTDCDSFIVPLVQYKSAGLIEKEEFLNFLKASLPEKAQVYLSSGYFNPSRTVSDLRLDHVLAPSESANGFFGGRGLLSQVPKLYSALHSKYTESHPNCNFSCYMKHDWSFHGKGLWVEDVDGLYIHLIGSSNFNHRSSNRDFELQFLLLTSNYNLSSLLKEERQALWSESSLTGAESFSSVNLIHRMIARILRSIL